MRGLMKRQPSVLSWSVASPRGTARGFGITAARATSTRRRPRRTRSASPATTAWRAPIDRLQARAAEAVDRRAGTVTGRPASSRAMRATLRLSSPAWLAQPRKTSSTAGGDAGARAPPRRSRARRGRRAARRRARRRSARSACAQRRGSQRASSELGTHRAIVCNAAGLSRLQAWRVARYRRQAGVRSRAQPLLVRASPSEFAPFPAATEVGYRSPSSIDRGTSLRVLVQNYW